MAAPTPRWRCAATPGSARLDPSRLAALEWRLDHRFADAALLLRALTHASWAAEHAGEPAQEPLAFLGDAALGLVVAEHLLDVDPAAPVGRLTPMRAAVVADEALTRWAAVLELGAGLRLGRGAEQDGGRTMPSILATTLEAVLGALYLDAGLPAVRTVVGRLAGWPPLRMLG
ncbi:MAG TPA: ribonuclease III domain-containing protein [Methylomirabilota bacterium]|nr:ribonuclease III domain-containing protein [Methylomirabilota bacterium]